MHNKNLVKYLFFKCNGIRFASKLATIREAIQKLPFEKSPSPHAESLGVSSLRGEIIVIRSLAKIIWGKTSKQEAFTLIVEKDHEKEGWLIESIERVIQIPQTEIKHSSTKQSDVDSITHTNEFIELDSEIIHVLDIEKLWQNKGA